MLDLTFKPCTAIGQFHNLGADRLERASAYEEALPGRLLAKRRAMGWSIKKAARHLGVDEGTWGDWERGDDLIPEAPNIGCSISRAVCRRDSSSNERSVESTSHEDTSGNTLVRGSQRLPEQGSKLQPAYKFPTQVRQPAGQPAVGPVDAANKAEGKRLAESVPPASQHREVGASSIR